MKTVLIGIMAAILMSFFGANVYGHHSGSRYDFGKTVTIEGSIREFQWTNPHVIIWVEVKTPSVQEPQVWAVQATSPGNLRRNGWQHNSLKPGDQVKVDLHPLRDGGTGGGLEKITIVSSGEVLYHFSRQLESR